MRIEDIPDHIVQAATEALLADDWPTRRDLSDGDMLAIIEAIIGAVAPLLTPSGLGWRIYAHRSRIHCCPAHPVSPSATRTCEMPITSRWCCRADCPCHTLDNAGA